MNVRSLRRLLPVGPRISTLVRRAARQGGMGRDNLLIMPEHGIISGQTPVWPYQDQRTCTHRGAIPGTACHVSGDGIEEKEDPASLKDLICL